MAQGCYCGRCSGCRMAWEAGERDDNTAEEADERETAMNLENLKALALSSLEWSENIGEELWFVGPELLHAFNINGLSGMGEPDAAYIAAMSPKDALRLIEVAKAAKAVAYSNGFDAAYPEKLEALKAACKALEG